MRREEPDRGTDGFALVMVLVFMLVVSAVLVPFAVGAKTRLMIARNMSEQQRMRLLADGLVTVLSGRLARRQAELAGDGVLQQCQAGRFTFAARIQDHRGLIDLNAADALQLAAGFEALGFDPAKAAELAASTVASRSPPAAFSSEGGKASVAAKRKAAPFESVSELALVAPDVLRLDDTSRIFTVFSKVGFADPTLAPAMLRRKLKIDTREATSGDVYSLQVTIGTRPSGIVGAAGYIVSRAGDGRFDRVALLPPLSLDDPDHSPLVPCPALFGEKPAQLIAEWASG